jgi:hypothetical protein
MRHGAAAFNFKSSALRRYAGAVKMGPFPDGNRPQMEAPSALLAGTSTMLVSLPSTKFRPA